MDEWICTGEVSDTLLGLSIYLGKDVDFMKYIIEEMGADCNFETFDQTPLIKSIIIQNPDFKGPDYKRPTCHKFFEYIVGRPEVNINHITKSGDSALQYACEYKKCYLQNKVI